MPHDIAYTAVPALSHNDDTHPENNARVPAILDALRADNQLESMLALDTAPATRDQLATCHTRDYIDLLERTMAQAPGYLDYAPTYITTDSFEQARLSAGGAIAAVDALLNGQASASLALIRPPGHHAIPRFAMGFCLFNNIAIAARHAQVRGINRVMIVDFDVHHGNGTQDIFYEDDTVLFVSTHQEGIYPGTGQVSQTGAERGRGYTINIPLPLGAGDNALVTALTAIATPAAHRFAPELILVSAGFDAHFRDTLAGLSVSGTGFHRATTVLAELADTHAAGRLGIVLEGGYDLPALSNGVVNVVRALRGQPPDERLGPTPNTEPDLTGHFDAIRTRHDLG